MIQLYTLKRLLTFYSLQRIWGGVILETRMEQLARTPRQIGDAIRRQRRKLELNQTSLGDRTKLRQATISAVEAGASGSQLGTLCNILAALDLELVIRPRTKAKPTEIEDIF